MFFDWFKRTEPDGEPEPPRVWPPKCTYCGGIEFYEGPSGGMSTNVRCANEECRHWFNCTPALRLFEDLHRVDPSEAEKVEQRRRAEEAREALPDEINGNLYCTLDEAEFAAQFWFDRGHHLTPSWFFNQLTRHRMRHDLNARTQFGHYGGPPRYAWDATQEGVPKAPCVYNGPINNDNIVGIRLISVLIGQIAAPPDWFDPEGHREAWLESKSS